MVGEYGSWFYRLLFDMIVRQQSGRGKNNTWNWEPVRAYSEEASWIYLAVL